MQDFFKSKLFKILLITIALLSGLVAFEISSNKHLVLEHLISKVTKPTCKLVTTINDSVVGFFDEFFRSGFYKEKNLLLEEELIKMKKNLVELDRLRVENEQLRQFANIKNSNKNFEVEMATIISKDPDELSEFTIDVGSSKGISNEAAVITKKGLVGVVTKADRDSSKITTILGAQIKVPALDGEKEEKGVVCGSTDLINDGLCKMLHLSKETKCEVGDLITTSGVKNTFPKDILIGKIKEIKTNENGISSYAIIEPSEDLNSIKDVLVVKNFI